jgi:hypothetical protein
LAKIFAVSNGLYRRSFSFGRRPKSLFGPDKPRIGVAIEKFYRSIEKIDNDACTALIGDGAEIDRALRSHF